MKIQNIILIILLIFGLAACGASKESKYTPDPSITDMSDFGVAGEEITVDDQSSAGSDSGEDQETIAEVETEKEKETDQEKTCKEDEFCLKTCEDTDDCSDGYQCIMRICTFDCQSDSDCGVNGKCNDVGFCEQMLGKSIPECKSNDDCGNGRFCNAAKACEKVAVNLGCMSDVDCPPSQYCNKFNECNLIPASGFLCNNETPCPLGYHCGAFDVCEQICRTSFQCSDGEACAFDGQCIAVGKPSKLGTFNFSSVVAADSPTQKPIFKGKSYMITNVSITSVGRNVVLISPRFRLIGNVDF